MGDILNRRGKLYIRWYDGTGKRKLLATACKNEREAKILIRDKEAEAQKVRDGRLEQPAGPTDGERRRRTITVADLVKHFLGDVEGDPGYAPPKIKSLDHYRRDARKNLGARLPATFTSKTASSVRLVDIERVRDGLLARDLAGASVVQVLAALSKVFNWSRKMGLVDCANPVTGVERPHCEVSVDFLDKAESARLLELAEKRAGGKKATITVRMLHPMIATAVYCGLRKGELFGLRWRDVNLDGKRITVARSYELAPKSGKPRHLPLHANLDPVLRLWRAHCPETPDALVFPVEADPGRFRMGDDGDMLDLPELLKAAECHAPADGHPWHMLRHTFASHAVMAGVSLYSLQRLLGHSTPIMTQRYAHLAPDFLGTELARLDFTAPAPAKVTNMADARLMRAVKGDKAGIQTGIQSEQRSKRPARKSLPSV